ELQDGMAFLADDSVEELTVRLVCAPEYANGHGGGTTDGLLAAAYRDLLGREIDPTGLAYWGAQLRAGVACEVVIRGILGSLEAVTNAVTAAYTSYLRRAPDLDGLQAWVDQLSGGPALRDVLPTFLRSAEYLGPGFRSPVPLLRFGAVAYSAKEGQSLAIP